MSTAPITPARNAYLDFGKGFLIFLVVWGHLIQVIGYAGDDVYEDPIFKAIYIFHMPLFIALSGYLSYASINRTPWQTTITRRLFQLIVPLFVWSAAFCVAMSAEAVVRGGADMHGTLTRFPFEVFKTAQSFWFLWAVFLFTSMVAVLKRWRMDTVLPMLLACVVYALVPRLGKDYLFKFTLPFFCIGYQIARFGVPSFLNKWWVTAATATASVACYALWQRDDYVYVSQMALDSRGIQIIFFRLAAAIVSSMFVLKALLAVYPLPLLSPFVWFGKRSLEIYILHSFILKMAHGFPNLFPGSILFSICEAPLLALALCLISAAGEELVSRWKRRRKQAANRMAAASPISECQK